MPKFEISRSDIMDNCTINITTANIRITNLYWFGHHCYHAFDIWFDNASTCLLDNIIAIAAGHNEEESEQFLNSVKQHFSNAGISNGDSVSILYTGTRALAIGIPGKDLWVDVNDGILPHIPLKTSSELGFNIDS